MERSSNSKNGVSLKTRNKHTNHVLFKREVFGRSNETKQHHVHCFSVKNNKIKILRDGLTQPEQNQRSTTKQNILQREDEKDLFKLERER